MGLILAPAEMLRRSTSYQDALDRAATLWGIEPGYWDIWGNRHATSPDVAQAILQALGVRSASREELDAEVEERLWREWSRLLPPTLVIGESDSARQLPLYLPEEASAENLSIEFRWEAGTTESREYSLTELRETASATLRGKRYVCKMAPLPETLPLGYHEVQVTLGSAAGQVKRDSMHLIVCPDRAYFPERLSGDSLAAGVAVSLYGVRSARNWGCGDFTDLAGIISWVAEDIGGSFVGLNPLHAIHNRGPYNTSPYLPNCTFYRNPIYIDVERVEDFRNSSRASLDYNRPEVQAELEALRAAEYVEYERVYDLKLRFLKLAFERFLKELSRQSERAILFRRFVQSEGELLDRYATYAVLDEWLHAQNPEIWTWIDWPVEYRDPDSDAVAEFARKNASAILFHKYLQWQADLQLAEVKDHGRHLGLSIGLYHDLALATDRCGSDLWAHNSFYVSGCRVGAPPDDFSPRGQDWAFPPPNAEHHRESGYRLFAESIRKNCRHAGALRIDHVMRFFRLFWVPEGADPTRGAYVRDNYEDLVRILALESVRQKVVIVGEDLGTVEPRVRDFLGKFGILSYRLFYFEKDEQGAFRLPQEYPPQALVSISTHDLPTLAGFWTGRDIEARQQSGLLPDEEAYQEQLRDRTIEKQKMLDALLHAGLLPESFPSNANEVTELTGELHSAVIAFLASTPAKLLLLNQEDLTKETEQQNLPGATWQYPNWRRKMKFSVEELRTEEAARDFARMFRARLKEAGRINL